MDLCNEFCSSGRPSSVAKTLTFDITRKFFNQSFLTYHAYRHYLLLPFDTTFTDLDLAWGKKVSAKPNHMASCSQTLFN